MDRDFLTLQEAAILLGKSVQTIRRMIKKGELKSQKIKTPQGFHYVIKKEDLGIQMFSNSPIQNDDPAEEEAVEEDLTNQNEILTNQTAVEVHVEADSEPIDKNVPVEVENPSPSLCEKCEEHENKLSEVLGSQHREKMALIRILGKLQSELDYERRKPRSFIGHLMDWLLK